jgi:electron transfer flavoprotein alpha subunit
MKVLVYVEKKEKQVALSSLELFTLARKLGEEVDAILIGSDFDQAAEDIAKAGAKKLYIIKKEKALTEEEIVKLLAPLAKDYDLILFPASRKGRSLTAQLAGKLDVASLNDVIKLEEKEGKLFAKRPVYAGRLEETIKILADKAVISIRSGSYEKPGEREREKPLEREKIEAAEKISLQTKIVEILEKTEKEIDLKEAKIIVSGGRGMGSKENYEKLCGELARVLDAGLGASRSAVNNGWIDRSHQVGQTGNLVKPDLYIACGISGAAQHQAGMKESKYILAINKDENAEIFEIADLAIVGDVNEIMPLLIEEIKKKREKG